MVRTKTEKTLDGIYKFLSESYRGNWVYRWQNTPYLKDALKKRKAESVVGHVWGTMEFWFHLRRVCPSLNSLVNPIEVYEILLNHDLGETYAGDLPLYIRVTQKKDNAHNERKSFLKIIRNTPKYRKELLANFDEFEKEIGKINKLEVAVAKWIDNLQGNHCVLTFGTNLPKYSDAINKILQIRFIVYTNRLLEILEKNKATKAIREVKQVAKHHANIIKKAGINFDTSGLKC